jgi:signal peptidase
VGDLLVVQGVGSVSDISVGDVLIIDRSPWNPTPLTHRVLALWVEDGRVKVVTKGDGNDHLINDDMVFPEQIVGKVIFVVPKLGYISLWFQGR